jgi:hypothetical protein
MTLQLNDIKEHIRIAAVHLGGETELMRCLTLHYSDICSYGDLAINRILRWTHGCTPEDLEYGCYIIATIDSWLVAGHCKPDPWH